jgi:hypothetical protein
MIVRCTACGLRNRVIKGREGEAVCGRCGWDLLPERPPVGLWRLGPIRGDLWRPHPADYFWRNRYEAVMFRFVPDDRGGGHFELLSLDVRPRPDASSYTVLDAFNERNGSLLTAGTVRVTFVGIGDEEHPTPPECSASPDGEWLSWIARVSDQEHHWIAASLDGRERLAWRLPEPGSSGRCYPAWVCDGRTCAMLVLSRSTPYRFTHAVVRHVDRPSEEATVQIGGLADGLRCGVDEWGRVVILHQDPREACDVLSLSALDLGSGAAQVSEIRVRLTAPARVMDVAPCPERPQLAWIAQPDEPGALSEIWVGGTEEEAPRRLLALPGYAEWTERRVTGTQFHHPSDLAWIPGEEWLSFRYGHALWAVPAAAEEP